MLGVVKESQLRKMTFDRNQSTYIVWIEKKNLKVMAKKITSRQLLLPHQRY